MCFGFNEVLAKCRRHANQFGKFGIVPRAHKAQQAKEKEDKKSDGCVAPGAAKGLRQFPRKEVANPFASLGVGPVDTTMGTDHETVEVIDKTWISRLCPGNCQVRGSTSVDATQLAHFLALQPP